METAIIVAGFGGQGVLFAGQLLALAGMESGQHVTWIPSYGPEMRGGTAHCTVIISDEPIGAPIVARPDIAIVLNQPSFEKYEPLVKSSGLLLVNSSLIDNKSKRTDLTEVRIPANELASQYGTSKMLNMAAIGGMLAFRPLVSMDAITHALAGYLGEKKAHLVDENLVVLNQAYQYAQQLDRPVIIK